MAAMAVAAPIAHLSFGGAVNRWDTRWLVRAAAHGWPSRLVTVHGHVKATTIAFFPLFPLISRWTSDVTGAPLFFSAAMLSSVTGLSAVVAVWILVRDYAGHNAADRASFLFAMFPGSFVFSLAYAEGIVITLVALGLVALRRRCWVLAGVAGALATAASPVALAFGISCLWTAIVEVRSSRDWRVLAAPVLAPVGFVCYQLWLWVHTGNAWAWKLTERGGWDSYLSVRYPLHVVWQLVTLGSTANMNVIAAATFVAAIGMVLALRDRQPAPIFLYGLGVCVAAVLTAPVGLRPRFVLDAFPFVAVMGVHLRGKRFRYALGASVIGLVALTVFSVDSFKVFP